MLGLSYGIANAQVQVLLDKADLLSEQTAYDESYLTYKQAGDEALNNNQHLQYLVARSGMARCTQFTTIVNRSDIADVVGPAITLVENEDSLKQTKEAAELYYYLGRHQWAIQGDYDAAEKTFARSIAIADKIGEDGLQQKMECYSDLVNVFANQEKFDTALHCAQMALQFSRDIFGENHAENGQRLYRLGFLYYRKGHYPQAVKYIQEGIQQIEENNGAELQVGLGYSNLSAVYVAMLDKEGTLESSEAARQIFEKNLGSEHEAIANLNWDLGSLYTDLEDYSKGEEHYKKAIDIFIKNFGPDFSQLPLLYHQLGFCYDQQSLFDEAESWHQKGLKITEDRYGKLHPRTGDSYRQLADHYNSAQEFDLALQMIQQGLPIINDTSNQSNILKAWLYEELGDTHMGQENFLQADSAFELALAAICTGEPTAENSFNPLYYSDYRNKQSSSLFSAFKKDGNIELLEKALNAAEESHLGILKLRQNYRGSESKIFLQQRARDHYDLALEILFELYQLKNDAKYIEQAWIISEESKSLLLLEELKVADIEFNDVPQEVLDSLENMRLDLAFYQQNILFALDVGDTSSASEYKRGYFSLNNTLLNFENHLNDKYPQYAQLKYDLRPSEIGEVQGAIDHSSALIEYYLAKEHYYIFTITDNKAHWFQYQKSDQFSKSVLNVTREIQDLDKVLKNPEGSIAQYFQYSHNLFQELFPQEVTQLISKKEKIIIVPDQELGYISFEALSPDRQSYLLQFYAITYAYSGSMYAILMQNTSRKSFDRFAGFAPSYVATNAAALENNDLSYLYRDGTINLPGAQEEVRNIHALVAGDIWLDSTATRHNFVENAPNYHMLHLSLHGLVEEDDPMRSRLLFHGTDDDQGSLFAYEVYNMELEADMVALSACNTASGTLQRGEGILSLARAFAYAGVPNLIANLWRADDKASSEIMVAFYHHLSEGATKDEALRQAKLEFIEKQKTKTLQHPYFWSSQILIGENDSTYRKQNQWFWWIASCSILLVIGYWIRSKLR